MSDSSVSPASTVGTIPSASLVSDTSPRFRRAFEALLPENQALKAEELMQINLDIPTALTTVLGAWPRIQAMRPQIVAHLSTFDLHRFDRIEQYALALGYAQAEYMSVEATAEGLPMLGEQAMKQRELFLSVARSLVLWGLLKPEQLAQFKGLTGYRNVAFELMGLAGLFRKEWGEVQARSGLTLGDLEEAERMGEQVLSALGMREQSAPSAIEAVQHRQRAFTLLMRAYNDAIRAITHLRWEQDDADSIIPPLYAGRGRKGKATAEGGKAPAPVAPGGTAASPVAPVAPVSPVAPVAPVAPVVPATPVIPGQPGGSPFLS